ncbi:hypothetical protein BaRGS_00028603 [Batillaria attramentaria]|uniref:Uncharacterized protein n=1 Tax=Batillaria attramentaria TaxID=370345 RepID=A0ABD0JZH8_9CAEN
MALSTDSRRLKQQQQKQRPRFTIDHTNSCRRDLKCSVPHWKQRQDYSESLERTTLGAQQLSAKKTVRDRQEKEDTKNMEEKKHHLAPLPSAFGCGDRIRGFTPLSAVFMAWLCLVMPVFLWLQESN